MTVLNVCAHRSKLLTQELSMETKTLSHIRRTYAGFTYENWKNSEFSVHEFSLNKGYF